MRDNLDLKLTPYKVLATSCKHGNKNCKHGNKHCKHGNVHLMHHACMVLACVNTKYTSFI